MSSLKLYLFLYDVIRSFRICYEFVVKKLFLFIIINVEHNCTAQYCLVEAVIIFFQITLINTNFKRTAFIWNINLF